MLIWLYSNTDIRIQGTIIGFDEYMNLVLDDAEEIKQVSRARTDWLVEKEARLSILLVCLIIFFF